MTTLPAVQTPRVFQPSATAYGPTQATTRTHCLPRNLWPANGGASQANVIPTTETRLRSMLDCEHGPGSSYVIVSKQSSRGRNVTSVLDVPLNRFYRAEHSHGLVTFWKSVAKRHPEAVKFVARGETYVPATPPAVHSRPY